MSSCPSPPYALNSRLATNPPLDQIRKTAKTAMFTAPVNIAAPRPRSPPLWIVGLSSPLLARDYPRHSCRGANGQRHANPPQPPPWWQSLPSVCPLTLTHSHLCAYTVGTFYGTRPMTCRVALPCRPTLRAS